MWNFSIYLSQTFYGLNVHTVQDEEGNFWSNYLKYLLNMGRKNHVTTRKRPKSGRASSADPAFRTERPRGQPTGEDPNLHCLLSTAFRDQLRTAKLWASWPSSDLLPKVRTKYCCALLHAGEIMVEQWIPSDKLKKRSFQWHGLW